MNQSFLNLRFDQINKRFSEIDILLELAEKSISSPEKYDALCRSAHVLLVSHLEGLYKDLCKDIIDDINANLNYHQVKDSIFNSYCSYFINPNDTAKNDSKAIKQIKDRLKIAFGENKCDLKVDPFLFFDNKNPTPVILEDILSKFGKKDFFWYIDGSDLDIAFKGGKSKVIKLRERLHRYLSRNTYYYPYTVDYSIINPIEGKGARPPKTKTFWEEFIDSLLRDRHIIVHGQIQTPQDHSELAEAKIKIQLLTYALMLVLCISSTPVYMLAETLTP